MEGQDEEEEEEEGEEREIIAAARVLEEPRKEGVNKRVGFRVIPVLLFPLLAFLLSCSVVGFLAILGGEVAIPALPASVPSQCRIVSSSVDIRSSKVCEVGVLNFKAKKVLYPSERSRFRCRYDYYWASVFQVEYRDHSLGQMKLALAEAPNEALPVSCRPNFGAAWLTKHKFKVNKTYECWYTSGWPKVTLYRDGFFHCEAENPTLVEMIGRYCILSTNYLQSLLDRRRGSWIWGTTAGFSLGVLTSFIVIAFIRFLHQERPWFLELSRTSMIRMFTCGINSILLRRVCFLVAYFSVMGWLTVQYGKRLGLQDLYSMKNY